MWNCNCFQLLLKSLFKDPKADFITLISQAILISNLESSDSFHFFQRWKNLNEDSNGISVSQCPSGLNRIFLLPWHCDPQCLWKVQDAETQVILRLTIWWGHKILTKLYYSLFVTCIREQVSTGSQKVLGWERSIIVQERPHRTEDV